MKKNLIIAAAFATLPFCLMAQDIKEEKIIKEDKEIKEEKKNKDKKKETKEIIIRQNGDKDIKLNVEINGDDITVNGKPLSEFKDADVTINKRKMTITDGKGQKYFFDYSPGSQSFNWDNNNFNEDQFKFNEDFSRGLGSITSDGAFLGVTTEEDEAGAKVTDVVKGSAAEKAGLKKGDIITKVAEDKITGPESLSDVIGSKKAKDEVKITYKRNGKESSVKTALGFRKNSSARTYSFSGPRGNARVFSLPRQAPMTNMEGFNQFDMPALEGNMDALSIFPKQKRIGLKLQDTEDGNGVKVINVEDSSTAAIAGLKNDDIITEIDEDKIDNTDDAREKLVPEEGKKSYKIKALRSGKEMTFEVKIPRKLKTANF